MQRNWKGVADPLFLFNTGTPVKNLLKVRRWEVGMKQYELASLLGCSASYLSMVENGRLEPPAEFKAKAAASLNLKLEELFPDENQNVITRTDACLIAS